MRRSAFTVVLVLALGLTLAFFLLPIAAVFLRVSPGTLLDQLGRDVVVDALVVTAKRASSRRRSSSSSARLRPTSLRAAGSGAAPSC